MEAEFELLFEMLEELSVGRRIRYVHEHPHQLVAVRLTLVMPAALNDLRLGRNGAELLFDFEEGIGNQSFGTACPSLNRRGRSISNRRSDLLIGSRAFHDEGYAFNRQRSQGSLWDQHVARRPGLERKPTSQIAQGATFGLKIRKANADHNLILAVFAAVDKPLRRNLGTAAIAFP